MPKKRIKNNPRQTVRQDTKTGFLEQIKWPESYVSLVMGAVVVIIIAILIASFIKGKKVGEISSDKTENNPQKAQELKDVTLSRKYEVATGDTLWSISEKYYKSGFNWTDIAKANKIENPDLIEKGTKIILPDIKENISSVNSALPEVTPTNAIPENSYTVQKGDDLWNIAVRAYGDGYKWVEIANANNLSEPGLIFSGNTLKLPR